MRGRRPQEQVSVLRGSATAADKPCIDAPHYILLHLTSQLAMKFTIKPTDPAKIDADVLILFCWQDGLEEFFRELKNISKLILEASKREDFKGSKKQFLITTSQSESGPYKVLIVGLGKKEEFNLNSLYFSVAQAVKKTQESKPNKIAIVIPEFWMKKFEVKQTVAATVEAVSLSTYRFIKYKSEEEQRKATKLEEVILNISAGKIALSDEGVRIGKVFADATTFARDLINEPSDITTPTTLAKIAQELVRSTKDKIKVKILEKEDIEKLGMRAFLAVAKGSDEPPKFIHLSYKQGRPKKKIVLIGKGITFDTGGLSLKGAEAMEWMKTDMSASAAVLAVFKALAALGSSVWVVGLIAACENMPSGKALKPGDIVRAMNGKTIEVLNTDAEGRLTLADAISYAVAREKPDEIIDLATLTGACIVALGEQIAGLWGNNEKLLDALEKAASETCELIWRMPLPDEYKDLLKSHIADLKNISQTKWGGAITASLFLKEFVGTTSWAHLDIAGPSYAEKDSPLVPAGGAGFGVRLILHYLTSQ